MIDNSDQKKAAETNEDDDGTAKKVKANVVKKDEAVLAPESGLARGKNEDEVGGGAKVKDVKEVVQADDRASQSKESKAAGDKPKDEKEVGDAYCSVVNDSAAVNL